MRTACWPPVKGHREAAGPLGNVSRPPMGKPLLRLPPAAKTTGSEVDRTSWLMNNAPADTNQGNEKRPRCFLTASLPSPLMRYLCWRPARGRPAGRMADRGPRKQSDTRRALDKAMDYLAAGPCGGGTVPKLCRKFDEHSAAYAVARARGTGPLNDADFARRRAAECCASGNPAAKFCWT